LARNGIDLYGDRILAFDTPTARIAGILSERARGQGQARGFGDIIITATARHHGLTILSRSIRHFVPMGIPVLDPFAPLPPA
jgi:toxin FitB